MGGQSLGLEAGLAGPREGQGPAEVMGSDGTRVAMSWASPPVAQGGRGDSSGTLPPALLGGRAGQAVLGAGHAEALQGMGSWVLPILRSRGRAWPGVSCPDLAAKGSAASQAPVEMPPPNTRAARCGGAGLKGSGSDTQVTHRVCPHSQELSSSSCLAAAFTSPWHSCVCVGGFPSVSSPSNPHLPPAFTPADPFALKQKPRPCHEGLSPALLQ